MYILIFAIEFPAKIVFRYLDLLLNVKNVECLYLWNGESQRKNVCEFFQDLDIFPLNKAIVKIVLHDLNLLFESKKN